MKITKKRLEKLIREELDASDNNKAKKEEIMTEELGILGVAAGTMLGILGLVGAKWTWDAAKIIFRNLDKQAKANARHALDNLEWEEHRRIFKELKSDQELMRMIDYHADLLELVTRYKGVRSPEMQATRAALKGESKRLTAMLDEKAMAVFQGSPSLKALVKGGRGRSALGGAKSSTRGIETRAIDFDKFGGDDTAV